MPTASRAVPVDDPRPTLWRITDRQTFASLRERGRRARHGLVSVTYLGPDLGSDDPPRVGFAISMAVGGAVDRNRVKRRLRAALRELGRDLPAGTYLISARAEAARTSWSALVADVRAAVVAATR
jgi:ribonuclease P protein component